MSKRRQNFEKVCVVLVNLNLKCLFTYPSTQAIHYKPKDLFDPNDCVMPTLVENDMINKRMGPESL